MVEIESWVIKYILGYIVYITFITIIVVNTTLGINIYDLTGEQKAILESTENDVFSLFNRLSVLNELNSGYAIISVITWILSIGFIIAIATAINEFIPFT